MLGRLVVELTASTAAFVSDMGKAAHQAIKQMEAMQASVDRAGKAMAIALGSAASTAAILTKRAIASADALQEMSQASGVSVESLSALGYAAGFSGITTEALSVSLSRLNRNIAETATGAGESKEAFDALGIKVKNADGTLKNADQVLNEVAIRFAQMEDGAGKSALAIQLFGRAGAAMIPMLNEGASGLGAMRFEAEQFGRIVSAETAAAAALLNDNLQRLTGLSQSLGNALMVAVIPNLQAFTDLLIQGSRDANAFNKAAESIKAVFQGFANFVNLVVLGMKRIVILIGLFESLKDIMLSIDWPSTKIAKMKGAFDAAMMTMGEAELSFLGFADAINTGNAALQQLRDNWDPSTMGAMWKSAAPQLTNKQDLEIQISAIRDFAKQYEEAIKLQNALVKEAAAQGQLTRQEEIAQTAASQSALIAVQVMTLQQEAEIYRQRGDKAKEFVAQQKIAALEASQAASEVIAAAQIATANQADEKRFAEMQAQRQLQRAQEVEQIRRGLLTQRELEVESYDQRRKLIEEQMALDFENADMYYKMLEDLKVQHEAAMGDLHAQGAMKRRQFDQMTMTEQAQSLAGHLKDLTSTVATHNRALFNINKVAGIADAIINAYVGISRTLAEYPYPWNIAMAALHAVVAFAQVQKIAGAQYGQTSAAPSIVGTAAAPPVQPVNTGDGGRGQTTIIQLRGDVFSREQVRLLLEQLNEEGRDGGRLVIA